MTTARRLRAELAAQLVESGHPEDVWLGVPGVITHIASLGLSPTDLLEAVAAGQLRVRYFGPAPIPRDPNPTLCGINAAELLAWLYEQDATQETLH
jgi:hypothetical protein